MRLAETRDIGKLSLRQIGHQLGGEHPYAVQLAIKRLLHDGLLLQNKRSQSILPADDKYAAGSLLSIPIFGRVSCGVPTELADNEPCGFVSVSPSLINARRAKETFALIAAGNSMDRANIGGNTVEDGDYVIVHKADGIQPRDNQYVISRIDEAYNLKRLRTDRLNRRVVLLSESSEPYPPIIIAEEDMEYYAIEGIAIDVVKGIRA